MTITQEEYLTQLEHIVRIQYKDAIEFITDNDPCRLDAFHAMARYYFAQGVKHARENTQLRWEDNAER